MKHIGAPLLNGPSVYELQRTGWTSEKNSVIETFPLYRCERQDIVGHFLVNFLLNSTIVQKKICNFEFSYHNYSCCILLLSFLELHKHLVIANYSNSFFTTILNIKLKQYIIMKKRTKILFILSGLLLLAIVIILSRLTTSAEVKMIVEVLFYTPIFFLFSQPYTGYSYKKSLNLLLVTSIILSSVVFTPQMTSFRFFVIGILSSVISYGISFLSCWLFRKESH